MANLQLDVSEGVKEFVSVADIEPQCNTPQPATETVKIEEVAPAKGVVRLSSMASKLEKISQNPASIEDFTFPYRLANRHNIKLDLRKIFQTIQQYFAPIPSVKGVVLFGSSVNIRQARHFFLPWKRTIKCKTPPNDVDIFVLLKKGTPIKHNQVILDGQSEIKHSSGYGSWTDVGIMQDGIDLFAVEETDFAKCLAAKETVPLAIIQTGVLLCGEFPYKLLNPARVCWQTNGTPILTCSNTRFVLPEVARSQPKCKK
jgi:hypothetical protein